MAVNREIWEHKGWLGYLQPKSLVVSAHALVDAQCVLDRDVGERRDLLRELCGEEEPTIGDFSAFAEKVLDWNLKNLDRFDEDNPVPDELKVVLTDYGETLQPDFAARDPFAHDACILLVQVFPQGTTLDKAGPRTSGWHASPFDRFVRLLRETGVGAGLLCNGSQLALVYAPGDQTPGFLVFPVKAMCESGGRDILSAFLMLLGVDRLFNQTDGRRLGDILANSRKYQNEVSARLAEQVIAGLDELLAGFQAADRLAAGNLLTTRTQADRRHIYGGLLTTVMRTVFLLYAEDSGTMPGDPLYVRYYSVSGLYKQLREDAAHYPDTMDQRFGAWSRLLSLFRLVFDGGGHGAMKLPARNGQLFDPEEFPFLEGRIPGGGWLGDEPLEVPRLPDGFIYRLLRNLLILDGERLTYSNLDVEEIGSVYQAMMGFDIEMARGHTIAVRPYGVYLDLDAVLAAEGAARITLLKETSCALNDKAKSAFKKAATLDDLVAALGRKRSPRSREILPPGSLFLQPGAERRRTGSHYTPRGLTKPIVTDTLQPLLDHFKGKPTPEQILDLKICDPAMGSGAFLVETCRQLAEHLVKAWQDRDYMPQLPPDENPLLHARRLIAQRCLYGVDKNPFAVNIAKLSLWLVTLARDHPFTFLDHALKAGDSLIGLDREQIGLFHWAEQRGHGPLFGDVNKAMVEASKFRRAIHELGDSGDSRKQRLHREAEDKLLESRITADLITASFFQETKPKERERKLVAHRALLSEALKSGRLEQVLLVCREFRESYDVTPFHWQVEFPEVFDRASPGFDAVVGNPPFAGKNTTINSNAPGFLPWLLSRHEDSHGNADLVAHFFRLAFRLIRNNGTLGLIATNTIGQGDTRHTGLRWICTHGGTIYKARRRIKWPGAAAVVVSVVHLRKGKPLPGCLLDGNPVPKITAFLFHDGGHDNPKRLKANDGKSFVGSYVLGMGFTFDDTDKKGVANPISEMDRLKKKDPRNAERIFPYIGGKELNKNAVLKPARYVINFEELSESEAWKWSDLMSIIVDKVKPERMKQKDKGAKERWWQFIRPRAEMRSAIKDLDQTLAIARVSQTGAFLFLSTSGLVHKSGHLKRGSLVRENGTLPVRPCSTTGSRPDRRQPLGPIVARLMNKPLLPM